MKYKGKDISVRVESEIDFNKIISIASINGIRPKYHLAKFYAKDTSKFVVLHDKVYDVWANENLMSQQDCYEQMTVEQFIKYTSMEIEPIGKLAMRHNEGKLDWSLVDMKSMEPLVQAMMFGASKYEADNWRKGTPIKTSLSCLMRHITAFMNGEDNAPDSGVSHLGHAMANLAFMIHDLREHPKLDNRYKATLKPTPAELDEYRH